MTPRQLSHYEVGRQETAESISRGFSMSWRAIRDIPANQHLRHRLPETGKVETGLLLAIPPHAGRLARERLQALHRLRPQMVTHFDRITQRAEAELLPLVVASATPGTSAEVKVVLAQLEQDASAELEALAAAAYVLGELSAAMALTHVASLADRQLAPPGEPLRGMYWILSSDHYQAWRQFWAHQNWHGRWQGESGETAWEALAQFLNTIRSIAIQGVDVKIRGDQGLERQLIAEFRDGVG